MAQQDILKLIHDEATAQGIPPEFAVNIAMVESNLNPGAVSPKGAQGVMQLMPDTARELGVKNSFDPAQNIRGGVTYLRQLWDKYQDPTLVAAAFNAGPGAVDKYGGVPPFPETQNYTNKVLGSVASFRQKAQEIDPEQFRVESPKSSWAEKLNQITGQLAGLAGNTANVISAFKGGTGTVGNTAIAQSLEQQKLQAAQDEKNRKQELTNQLISNPNLPNNLRVAAGAEARGVPAYAVQDALGINDDKMRARFELRQQFEEFKRGLAQNDPVKQSEAAMSLRKEYNARPAIKDYNTIKSATAKLNEVWNQFQKNKGDAKTKAFVDQALIIGFNKILDPTSVVRESEYARTPEGLSVINRIQGSFEKMQSGGGGLTDIERAELVKTMHQLSKGLESEVKNINKFYRDEALRSNIDPKRIMSEIEQPIESQPPQSSGQAREVTVGGKKIKYSVE